MQRFTEIKFRESAYKLSSDSSSRKAYWSWKFSFFKKKFLEITSYRKGVT